MPRAVVITRPLAQAAPLAARLAGMACEAQVFALLDIEPLADSTALKETLSRLQDYAMVAFVSANAVDAAFAHLAAWPQGVAAAVVGEGSRQALARHGLTNANATIISPRDLQRTDSETLLQELDLHALRGKKVLIVRAETGRELLADQLRAAGVAVEQIAAYRRLPPVLDDDKRQLLARLIRQNNDWIITSSEGLRFLQGMVEQVAGAQGWAAMLQKNVLVPHFRIAETARSLGFLQIIQTGSGDDALCAAIQSRT
jgi:uroporphyrinogen-III synthase